jgi:hypothetical protein
LAASLLAGGRPAAGETRGLLLTGELMDGTVFQATDCIRFVGPPPTSDRGNRGILKEPATRLFGALPNPFNPVTTIMYELASAGYVNISVYDISGRLVRNLVDRHVEAGRHEIVWNSLDGSGNAAASGIYFYRLTAPRFVETRKMVLLR